MELITWTDVRDTIPRPMQAHDATRGNRRVEARFWVTDASTTPYRIDIRFLENGVLLEGWTQEYSKNLSIAMSSYSKAKDMAVQWLEGFPLVKLRCGLTRYYK